MREVHLKFLQYLTGILLFFFLGLHMVIMHMENLLNILGIKMAEPTLWASVVERTKNASWLVFYFVFLLFVIYHALFGFRTIIMELSLSKTMVKLLNWILLIFGILVFIYAAYIPIKGVLEF